MTRTGILTTTFTWTTPGAKIITVTTLNATGAVSDTHVITLSDSSTFEPVRSVTIAGPAMGITNTAYTFTALAGPLTATLPISYTWTPAPGSGQGTATASYTWLTTGTKTITVTATNTGVPAGNTPTSFYWRKNRTISTCLLSCDSNRWPLQRSSSEKKPCEVGSLARLYCSTPGATWSAIGPDSALPGLRSRHATLGHAATAWTRTEKHLSLAAGFTSTYLPPVSSTPLTMRGRLCPPAFGSTISPKSTT